MESSRAEECLGSGSLSAAGQRSADSQTRAARKGTRESHGELAQCGKAHKCRSTVVRGAGERRRCLRTSVRDAGKRAQGSRVVVLQHGAIAKRLAPLTRLF